MNEPRDDGQADPVDPERLARVEDDFQRALRGEPRPIPRVPGVPTTYVERVWERFGRIYRYDPASGTPNELHEAVARVFWARVETEALQRLRATGRVLDAMDSSDPDLVRRIALDGWWQEVLKLAEEFTERLQVEGLLDSVSREAGDPSDLALRIYRMVDDWDPSPGEE